nr:ubiquitin hydrolase [Tanacetum cinerariifolium]
IRCNFLFKPFQSSFCLALDMRISAIVLQHRFNKSEFNLATYKRGLASVEEQLVFYKKNESKNAGEDISSEPKESHDAPLVKDRVLDNKDCSVESPVVVEKKTVVSTIAKVEVVRTKQQEKPVRKPVKYAEMYMSQGPKENQRNWNNLKSQQLGSNFVMYNKACFVCGSFEHVHANYNYHQRERVIHDSVSYNFVSAKAGEDPSYVLSRPEVD